MEIGEMTKIRLGVVGAMLVVSASSFMWVGHLKADVTRLKDDQSEYRQDIKEIKEKVYQIDGKVEYIINKRGK